MFSLIIFFSNIFFNIGNFNNQQQCEEAAKNLVHYHKVNEYFLENGDKPRDYEYIRYIIINSEISCKINDNRIEENRKIIEMKE